MTTTCDAVIERIALGEPLGEFAEHAATCVRCQRLVEMPGKLGATRHAVDPGLGFSARMTAGAQHKLVAWRRRRIAVGLAATVAAGTVGVFVMTRSPEERRNPVAVQSEKSDLPVAEVNPDEVNPDNTPAPLEDAELVELVRFADTDRSRRLSADWSRIQRPLAPYMQLVNHADSSDSDSEADDSDEGETP